MPYLIDYSDKPMPFHTKRALLWRFNVRRYVETCVGLNEKWPIFFSSILTKIFTTDFHNSPKYEILWKTFHWEPR